MRISISIAARVFTNARMTSTLPAGARGCRPRSLRGLPLLLAALLAASALSPSGAQENGFVDREPEALDAGYRPAEGSAPGRNPPAFVWAPASGAVGYALQVSANPEFAGEPTVDVQGLALNLYNPPKALAPGTWYWRYRVELPEGKGSPWSRGRAFTMAADAHAFEVPPVVEIAARLPQGHPRLFTTPAGLDAFRARRLGPAKAAWSGIEASAVSALGMMLPVEPDPPAGGDAGAAGTWTVAQPAADRLELQAFAYLAGGDPRFARDAARWLAHLAMWNPAGPTGHARHPDAARILLLKMARAYDWVHDALPPGERAKVLAALRARGEDAHRALREARFEWRPYDARHALLLDALSEAAVALYHDLPEAGAWLKYALPVHLALCPPWGGDAGGWSQGVTDWAWSAAWALMHAEAIGDATGVDLLKKPWYREAGFFKLYGHPPLARGSAAGYPDTPPGAADRMAMERLASVHRVGAFQWYASRVAGQYSGIPGYLWAGENTASRPPADLPPSRLFTDAGVAALHSRPWDPADNIAFFFRSSPYGSWGQAHADQNTFTLDAFGEPLAIASHSPAWESDPRLREWMHQTRAHNGLLVNGLGQPIQTKDAAGRVTAFHAGEEYDYVVGDASEAYPGLLERWVRRVVFVRPRCFILLDEAESGADSRFEWTLHSLERMDVDEAAHTALLRRGSARLLARWLAPSRLVLAQTDQLPVPGLGASEPRHWHLSVTAPGEARSRRFLTLLLPFRAGGESRLPASELLEGPNALGVRVGSDLVGFRTSPEVESVTLGDIESDGEAFGVYRSLSGQASRLFLAAGSRLSVGGTLLLALPPGSTASLGVAGECVRACLNLGAAGDVQLRLPVAPSRVLLDGKPVALSEDAYHAETHLLRLRAPAGESRLAVNPPPETPLPAPPRLELLVARRAPEAAAAAPARGARAAAPPVERRSIPLGILRSVAGSLVAYGEVPAPPGPYRLEGARGASVLMGGRPAVENAVVWLAGPTDIQVEAAPEEMPRGLRLASVALGQELLAQRIPEQALEWPEILRFEAEKPDSQSGGEASAGMEHDFLSGGSALAGWHLPGHQVTWRFRVPRAGSYLLMLKAAASEGEVRRLIRYDDRHTPDAWRPVTFAPTGGPGSRPEEWVLYRITEPVSLTAGEHTVTMTVLSGGLNLDLLALQPAE